MAACKSIEAEVLVVDNNSNDDSIPFLHKYFPEVITIEGKENVGFARANNRALKQVKGEYVVFLNPDTIIGETTFTELISRLKFNPYYAAAGVKMIDGSGEFLPESKRSFPSLLSSFYKLSGLAAMFPRSSFFNAYALGNKDENGCYAVPVLAGALILMRTEVAKQLNGFDEDYFMYGEDIDLCYRIKKAGFACLYAGHVRILHFKGESTDKNDSEYAKRFYGAMRIFIQKHYPPYKIKLYSLLIYITAFTKKLITKQSIQKEFSTKTKALIIGAEPNNCCEQVLLSNNFTKVEHIRFNQLNDMYSDMHLVFCPDAEFSYENSLHLFEAYAVNNYCYWFNAKDQSVIAAFDRTSRGIVLTAKL